MDAQPADFTLVQRYIKVRFCHGQGIKWRALVSLGDRDVEFARSERNPNQKIAVAAMAMVNSIGKKFFKNEIELEAGPPRNRRARAEALKEFPGRAPGA